STPGGRLKDSKAGIHPAVKVTLGLVPVRRRAEAADTYVHQLAFSPPVPPAAGAPRWRRIDRYDVRAGLVDERPDVLDLHPPSYRHVGEVLVEDDRVEALPFLRDVDAERAQRCHGFRCRWAKNSRRSARVSTPSTCPPFDTSTAGEPWSE